MKAGVITQARMTSSRLPGKILKKVNGIPLLEYHVRNLQQAGLDVYIATTNLLTDNLVEEWARYHNVKYFRGDENDVLERYYQCAVKFDLQTIIRTTCDCPLIDGELIYDALQQFNTLQDENVYLSNVLHRTFPRGLDFEIFSFKQLKQAYNNATEASHREHVTPYINQNKSGNTNLKHIHSSIDGHEFRITVDEPEDFELVERLILDYKADTLNAGQLTKLLQDNPELTQINAHIEQRKV